MNVKPRKPSSVLSRLWNSANFKEDEKELVELYNLLLVKYTADTGLYTTDIAVLSEHYKATLGVGIGDDDIPVFLLRIARLLERKMPLYMLEVDDIVFYERRKCSCGENKWIKKKSVYECSKCGMYD